MFFSFSLYEITFQVKRILLSTGYLRTVTFEVEAWITSAEVSVIQLFSIGHKIMVSKAPRFQIFSDFFFQASQLQACWRGYDLLGSSLSRRGKEFQTRYNHVYAGTPIRFVTSHGTWPLLQS